MDINPYQPQPAQVTEDNVRRSLVEIYTRIEELLETIPDDIDEDDLTEDQLDTVANICSMEEEWIIDPVLRRELSVIDWTDEPDEG